MYYPTKDYNDNKENNWEKSLQNTSKQYEPYLKGLDIAMYTSFCTGMILLITLSIINIFN